MPLAAARRQETLPIPKHLRSRRSWWVRMRGQIAIAVLLPFIIAAVCSKPWFPLDAWPAVVLRGLGWACFLAGAAMRFWATLYIGGIKGKLLVSEGPYSLCRNPLYLGTALLAVSLVFFLQSLIFAAGLLLAGAIYFGITIPAEEKSLAEKAGVEYQRYLATTPRMWPAFVLFHTPRWVEIDTRALAHEVRRACRWVWIPFLGILLTYLRSRADFPDFFAGM